MFSPDPIHAGWEVSNGFCVAGAAILIKGSQVGSHKGKCVSAMLWAAEGGENCDKRNVFDKRNVVVESMGCRGGGKL